MMHMLAGGARENKKGFLRIVELIQNQMKRLNDSISE
jgi:hypothetical protein